MRGYHDLLHLTEVLDRIDELTGAGLAGDGPAGAAGRVVPRRGVRRAARRRGPQRRWAEEALADTEHAAEVARLVRLTEHHDPADDDLAGQVLCDADLAILAASPERYDAYVTGVRRDYAYVSDTDFAVGRTAVLRDLPGRGRLFHTPYAREHWEPTHAPTWPASWRGWGRPEFTVSSCEVGEASTSHGELTV